MDAQKKPLFIQGIENPETIDEDASKEDFLSNPEKKSVTKIFKFKTNELRKLKPTITSLRPSVEIDD